MKSRLQISVNSEAELILLPESIANCSHEMAVIYRLDAIDGKDKQWLLLTGCMHPNHSAFVITPIVRSKEVCTAL